jgi:hypothetical protein
MGEPRPLTTLWAFTACYRDECSATWNLGINSAFTLGSRKTTKTLDWVGQSQDLPDANWLLASSPALNTRTLTLVPIWLLLYLKKKKSLHVFCRFFYVHTLDEHQPVEEMHYVSATKINQLMLFREKSLFIVRTTRNIQIHSMGRMQSFSNVKQVVHIVTIVHIVW